jgi:DNA-directed RNA polymerase specialized sigma subunit
MPAHLQAVIDAIYTDGLTERETAKRLNVTRYEVRKRHAQAIAIMRCELA